MSRRLVAPAVLEWELPTERSAEADAVETDQRSRLWACVKQLPERCQRLLRIVAFDDRPDDRGLAEQLDMPVGSIGPTRGRCLAKLKALLADEDHDIAEKYGAWQKRSLYGREFMGVARTTYLIGPDGKVQHRWDKVKVDGHADEVLEALG